MMQSIRAIVLAAGKSTRFKTSTNKLFFPLCGKPLITYPLATLQKLKIPTTIVCNDSIKSMQKVIAQEKFTNIEYALQKKPLGTGDALLCSAKTWNKKHILILNGDVPLISSNILKNLYQIHTKNNATFSFLYAHAVDPTGYGRLVQNKIGLKIVEEKNCTLQQRLINMVNAGVYLIEKDFLKSSIHSLEQNNLTKEFYLTDLVKIANKQKEKIEPIAVPFQSICGVNTIEEFEQVKTLKEQAIITHWFKHGVHFQNSKNTLIDSTVSLQKGTHIGAGVHLLGTTSIGKNTVVEPFSIIKDTTIGQNSLIRSHCVIEESKIADNVQIGPFARLRNNAIIEQNSVIGNFVEVKKSTIGKNTKAKHLTYLGDATIEESVNIGAGTITCNHDGQKKHKTHIEKNAYIGSNTTLIAPIKIGKGAYTAAGSTINKDVDQDDLAIGRARQANKAGYAKKLRGEPVNKK